MKRRLRLIPLIFPLVVLTACSSFDSRFARMAQGGSPEDHFSGAYAGRWASSSHPGAGGKLRCILQRRNDATCLAEFRATWHGIFSSEHSVPLTTSMARRGASSPDGSRSFSGTAALKTFIGAGTYHCEGTLDGNRMRACYDATYDRGTFDLRRVNATGEGRD